MKVLIVDDEAIVRIGLKSIINWAEEGFDCVLEAGNGVEALSLVQKEAPDLIITDIKMPEMNGLELIEALKENQNGASIIVLSSYDDFEFVRQAMKLGATDYILKLQMTEASLSETIRSAMANKHVHNPKDIQGFSRNLQYLQNKLLRDALILGGETQRILSDMAKALQLCIDPQNCILAVLRYEPVEEACTDAEHKRIFKSALSNTILEICKSKYLFHSVDLDERKLCLLLSGNHECDMSTDAFKPYAYLIVEMLLNYMNLSSTICLCYVGHEGLHSAYVQNEAACGLHDMCIPEENVYDLSMLNHFPQILHDTNGFLCCLQAVTSSFHEAIATQDIDQFKSRAQREISDAFQRSKSAGILLLIALQSCTFSAARSAHIRVQTHLQVRKDIDAQTALQAAEEMVQILSEIIRQIPHYPHAIKEAIKYIEGHYYESITSKDVAEYVGLSSSYFSALFRQAVGSNPSDFIIDFRLRKAKQLLKESNYRIYEIAEMVGYENNFYFNRLFKKVVGCTPKEYRNG